MERGQETLRNIGKACAMDDATPCVDSLACIDGKESRKTVCFFKGLATKIKELFLLRKMGGYRLSGRATKNRTFSAAMTMKKLCHVQNFSQGRGHGNRPLHPRINVFFMVARSSQKFDRHLL